MAFAVQDLMDNSQSLTTARLDESLQAALTRMTENDFSQLPVVDDNNKPLGLITSDSIVRALDHLGGKVSDFRVSHAVIKASEYRPDDDLFDLLNALRDRYAVLIVDGQRRLSGIITSYDATEYFRRRAQDIMLVEDIEGALKDQILAVFTDDSGKVDNAKLEAAIAETTDPKREIRKQFEKAIKQYLQLRENSLAGFNPELADKAFLTQFGENEPPKAFDELTLNEYAQLLLGKSQWDQVQPMLRLSKEHMQKLLDSVRETRNILAHFRGEISANQREELQYCSTLLSRHQPFVKVAPPVDTGTAKPNGQPERTPPVTPPVASDFVPTEDTLDASDSKYAALALWLQGQAVDVDRIPLTFDEIEKIIGQRLPASARQHRSWWANDSVGHVQSQQWLGVGWRIAEIDILGERVTFARIVEREKAYIHFFSGLLTELRHRAKFAIRPGSPDGMNWHTVSGVPSTGPQFGALAFVFTRRGQFRIELYIDTGDGTKNKDLFDALYARKEAIESAFGEPLGWERMDGRRASRIGIYHVGAITDGKEKLVELRDWAVATMVRFQKVIDEEASRVLRGNK